MSPGPNSYIKGKKEGPGGNRRVWRGERNLELLKKDEGDLLQAYDTGASTVDDDLHGKR